MRCRTVVEHLFSMKGITIVGQMEYFYHVIHILAKYGALASEDMVKQHRLIITCRSGSHSGIIFSIGHIFLSLCLYVCSWMWLSNICWWLLTKLLQLIYSTWLAWPCRFVYWTSYQPTCWRLLFANMQK